MIPRLIGIPSVSVIGKKVELGSSALKGYAVVHSNLLFELLLDGAQGDALCITPGQFWNALIPYCNYFHSKELEAFNCPTSKASALRLGTLLELPEDHRDTLTKAPIEQDIWADSRNS